MRKLIYIIFFYSSFFLSQISIDIKFINRDNEFGKSKLLEIRIKNNSDMSYALPLDTTDFKPFYEDELCVDFSSSESYQDLMLNTYIENENNNESLMALPKFRLMGNIDITDKKVVAEMNRRDSLVKIQNKDLEIWCKKNKIKQNKDWIIKNKFLYSNFIYLKPKQEVIYYKHLNLEKLNTDKISGNYNYYNLDFNNQYKFSLKYCIDDKIYNYLTEAQKIKLKKYNFFKGTLESNIIAYKINSK